MEGGKGGERSRARRERGRERLYYLFAVGLQSATAREREGVRACARESTRNRREAGDRERCWWCREEMSGGGHVK